MCAVISFSNNLQLIIPDICSQNTFVDITEKRNSLMCCISVSNQLDVLILFSLYK